METVCPALKLTQKCYLHINIFYKNINIFFLKTANLIINWLSLMPHVILLKDHPHHLTKYEGKGAKISIFKLFTELGTFWKCNLCFSKIPISRLFLWIGKNLEKYTAPDQNLCMSWENLCPDLSFTVENKMGNSHKWG